MRYEQLEVACLANLGDLRVRSGEPERAIELLNQALASDRRMGNRREEGTDLGALGVAHRMLGNVPTAIEMHTQALHIAAEVGDYMREGVHGSNLARALTDVGRLDEAKGGFLRAIEIQRRVGDRERECINLADLGRLYADVGDVEQAEAYIGEGLGVARQIPYLRGQANALTNQGWQRMVAGDVGAAVASYERASEIARDCADRFTLSRALCGLASAYHHCHDVAAGRRVGEEAFALQFPYNSHACAVRLGLLCLEGGEPQAAADYLAQGMALCRAQLERAERFYDALCHRALAQLALGPPGEAIASYQQALGACSARGVVQAALADVRLLHALPEPPRGGEDAASLLEGALA
jgi:tetratricopeptide (TPR) repeat protein